MKATRLTSIAETDIAEAADFYEAQRAGLGAEFLDEVDATVDRVRQDPQAYGHQEGQVRVKLVHRFPYALYYRESHEEILILAVAHTSRLPGYW